MSDVAPASFFPTPLEIAGGIRWMRAHPVVATAAAAAAATAVSVLTFLKTRADDSEDELLYAEGAGPVEDADGSDYDDEERDTVLSTLSRRNRVRRRPVAMAVVVGREGELLPPTVDCHVRKLSEEICSSTDSDASSSPTRGRQSSFGEFDVDEPTMLPTVLGGRAAEAEDSSASPQWGWYVSTTPPEDYYQ